MSAETITVRAHCRACPARVELTVRGDLPVWGVLSELTRGHDEVSGGHCIAAPKSLLLAFGSDPRDTFRRDEPGALYQSIVPAKGLGRRLP